MTYAFDPLSQALSALADPTRRAIFDDLRQGECGVTDLAKRHPVSRPAVSQHLKVLELAKLVSVTPKGAHRIYAARPEGLTALRQYLDTMWDDALAAYAAEISAQNLKR